MNFFTLLGAIFITLKLIGYIVWPWWVVLSPIWGMLILIVLFHTSPVWLVWGLTKWDRWRFQRRRKK